MSSGRPDWYGSMTLHGRYTIAGVDSYKSIAVDEEGNLITLMTGLLDGVYTPIAVDDDGIMKANMALQDLEYLTVRIGYGTPTKREDDQTITDDDEESLFLSLGKGIVYNGLISSEDIDLASTEITILVDTVEIIRITMAELYTHNIKGNFNFRLSLSRYDTVNNAFTAIINTPITYESSMQIKLYHNSGANKDVYYNVYHGHITP